MTISEEKKEKIIELYEKGVSKKDIARIEGVSHPTIRSIIKENETIDNSEKLQERAEKIEKTLGGIFKYEDYTEESVLELIFNLKRIANESGNDLGAFIEDIEIIFDKYHKKTENPVKMFNFLLEISENLSLIHNVIEPERLIEAIENFYEREIEMEKAEDFIAEIEAKAERLVKNVKEEYNEIQEKIEHAQNELESLTSTNSLISAKLMEQPNKEKLQKALKRNNELQILAQNLALKGEMYEKENQVLKTMFERVYLVFPNEIENMIKMEIENE